MRVVVVVRRLCGCVVWIIVCLFVRRRVAVSWFNCVVCCNLCVFPCFWCVLLFPSGCFCMCVAVVVVRCCCLVLFVVGACCYRSFVCLLSCCCSLVMTVVGAVCLCLLLLLVVVR